ncbi:hypothetical protein EDB84DRAFT_1475145, partial [Lactarius hengduanensis]
VIRRIASWAVYPSHEVLKLGPIIVTATHHNMMWTLLCFAPIMQVKDGASWAALEYSKSPIDKPLVIVPCAIVYTNKSKYRSNVRPFGSPIAESRRATVKLLTRAVQSQLVELTINAPDWDTLYAARMARDLLWEDQESLDRDEYVNISQTLVDLFSTIDAGPELPSCAPSAQLTNSVLSSLPLPRSLDPSQPVALPSRLFTLLILVRDSLASLVRLPFFFVPLIVHLPAYVVARLGARLAIDEEETQAQNKVLFGMFFLMLIYPITFMVMWAFLWFTPIGAILSATLVWLFASYHNKTHRRMKRVGAAWRVLIGVWAPKERQDHRKRCNGGTTCFSSTVSRRRPRTGRVMRHVLRARAEAVRLLASCIAQLEAGPAEKRLHNCADPRTASSSDSSPPTPVWMAHAHEVVSYLRSRGAKVAALERGIEVEWIALNSDGDLSSAEDKEPASPLR